MAPNAVPVTSRKCEVLYLVSLGLSHAEIAQRLYVSVRTVENHLYQIKALMGTSNAAHSVGEAYRRSLLPMENHPYPDENTPKHLKPKTFLKTI